ncbi:hypothetical protein LCGC14_0808000 [marine sediment metagenome]|uniref:Uncharacterized protein n=1 Tax=marine sediment metagenome TaxID=412755 RepID=A0A0F9S7P5_9ZZZZ
MKRRLFLTIIFLFLWLLASGLIFLITGCGPVHKTESLWYGQSMTVFTPIGNFELEVPKIEDIEE